MEGVTLLRQEFETFRKSTLSEIESLKRKVRLLKKTLEKTSPDDIIKPRASLGEESHQIDKERKTMHAGAITQEDAFHATGGEEQLKNYHQLSTRQADRVCKAAHMAAIQEMMNHISERKGYSLFNVNQPAENSQTLDALYERAEQVQPQFVEKLNQLAKETGGTAIIPPIKSRNRAHMKALFKYRDGTPKGVAWHRLTDILRATLQYETIGDMYNGLVKVVDMLGESNVLEYNDRYQAKLPGGYRDLQLSIKVDDFVCELQLNTKDMLKAKETTGHRNYEVIRELKAAVKEGDLERVQRALQFGRQSMGSTIDKDEPEQNDFRNFLKNDKTGLLHVAASNGQSAILLELLQYGADVNRKNENEDTPLHLAVSGGYETCVWVLLDAGKANMNIMNKEGLDALGLGFILLWTLPSEEVTRAVITLASFMSPDNIEASKKSAEECRSKKLKNRVEVVNHARNGDYNKLLEDLRDYGHPDSITPNGETALEAALLNLNLKEVDLLVKHRASLATQPKKPSYLRLCQMSKLKGVKPVEYKELINLLLNAGAPVEDDAAAIFYQLSRSGDCSWSEREDLKFIVARWRDRQIAEESLKIVNKRVTVVNYARNGDYDKLLDDLTNLGDPDSMCNGETALEAALLNFNLKEVNLLVQFRASLQTQHKKPSYLRLCQLSKLKGVKPVEYKELINLLLQAGAPVEYDAMEAEILNLNLKEVDLLVQYAPSLTTPQEKPSYIRLCQMCKLKGQKPFEYKDLINLLLQAGAPVEYDAMEAEILNLNLKEVGLLLQYAPSLTTPQEKPSYIRLCQMSKLKEKKPDEYKELINLLLQKGAPVEERVGNDAAVIMYQLSRSGDCSWSEREDVKQVVARGQKKANEQEKKAIKAEALELMKEKKANERADVLKKHYKGKLLQVAKANGSCESMDEIMEEMEFGMTSWKEDSLTMGENKSEMTDYVKKTEVVKMSNLLNECRIPILDVCGRSGMQLSGKKTNEEKPDPRSIIECSLAEELSEAFDVFSKYVLIRLREIDISDQRIKATIDMLKKLLQNLHERNVKTIKALGLERLERSPKLKTQKDIENEIKEKRGWGPAAPKEALGPGGIPGPPRGGLMDAIKGGRGRGGRGGLLDAIQGGRGCGRGGGRGGLLDAIQGRGRCGRGGGRGGLLDAIQGRGRGGRGGGRGGLLDAIKGRGHGGRGGGGGRGGLLAAIAAHGGGGDSDL